MSPSDLAVLQASASVATLATLLCLPLAVVLAVAPRWHRTAVTPWMDALLLWPLRLSPAITGLLFVAWWKEGASLGASPAQGMPLAVLAAAAGVGALPLMVQTLRPGLEQHPAAMVRQLRTLGASHRRAWWAVHGRALGPGLLAATALGWATAWGESGAALVLAGALGTPALPQTVALALSQAAQSPAPLNAPHVLTWVACGVGVAVVAHGLAEWLRPRRAP